MSVQVVKIRDVKIGDRVLHNGEWRLVEWTAQGARNRDGIVKPINTWWSEVGGSDNGRRWSLRLLSRKLVAVEEL